MKINFVKILSLNRTGQSIHLYKQVFATFASCMLSVTSGFTFAYSSVLLPQLEADKDFPYDKSYDSWIASISPFAMLFGCLFAGAMSDGLGRKKGQLVLIPLFIIGWITMGFAKTNAVMLIGRFITGICTGSVRPNSMVYISEISDPKYRSITLFCPTLAIHIGGLISHTVGIWFHWRIACFLFTLPNIICFIILFFLKESPLWLLSKGRIDEGIDSFKMFRGDNPEAEKELASIIEKQRDKSEKFTLKDLCSIVFSKSFFKALSTAFLLFCGMHFCGVNMLSFYAMDLFKKTFSGDVDPYTLMIATDCIRIGAAAAVCLLAKLCSRKIAFLTCGFLTTIVLVALVVFLYLNPSGLIWLPLTLMVAYVTIATALGSLSWPFISEIFPSNIRGFGSGVSSGISFGLLFIAVKVTPGVMYTFGEKVMYAGFAILTLVTTVFLCFMLPDTDGKTLQDIEDNLYNKNQNTTSNKTTSTI